MEGNEKDNEFEEQSLEDRPSEKPEESPSEELQPPPEEPSTEPLAASTEPELSPKESQPLPEEPVPEEPAFEKPFSLEPVSEASAVEEVLLQLESEDWPSVKPSSGTKSVRSSTVEKTETMAEETGSRTSSTKSFKNFEGIEAVEKTVVKKEPNKAKLEDGVNMNLPIIGNFSCRDFLQKRSPFIHNPPEPEERRVRFQNPRTPREYIINLREDLADFQESHGLPRTRDYSFLSLGLALAQETARALCSLFLMFVELFPIVAIVSLLMRFAMDKLIEILETAEPVPKLKKTLIFLAQMIVILIPLWILIGTIIIPLIALIWSIFKRLAQFRGRGRCGEKPKPTEASDILRFLY